MGNATPLSPTETRDLHRIAGIMIPADTEYNVPAANDPAIFADIIASLGRDLPDVRVALDDLARQGLHELDDAQAEAAVLGFLAIPSRAATALSRAVLQCYYRDPQVLTSLGHETSPPYPRGNKLEQGDWSLLDAVRTRPPFWRDDRDARP